MPDEDIPSDYNEIHQVIFPEVVDNEINLEEEEQTNDNEIEQIISDPKLVEDVMKDNSPKYWKYVDDCILSTQIVSKHSAEYEEIFQDIRVGEIKLYPGSAQMFRIKLVTRIQNTICYARFVVRAKQMILGEGTVYYRRMFMIRHISEIHTLFNSVQDDALEDINAKLLELSQGKCYFYSHIPQIPPTFTIVVAQLIFPHDWTMHDVMICENPANFYLEYIVNHYEF